MAARTPCLHSCSTIRATSPNHEGGEGTDSEEVWIITDPSAIVFMCASLMESVLFFLITEAHFYPGSLQVTSRCAIRGQVSHVAIESTGIYWRPLFNLLEGECE